MSLREILAKRTCSTPRIKKLNISLLLNRLIHIVTKNCLMMWSIDDWLPKDRVIGSIEEMCDSHILRIFKREFLHYIFLIIE